MSSNIPRFQNYIEWNGRQLPVDQATSFSVFETEMGHDASSPKRYSVIIDLNTARIGYPVGIATYHLQSASASKVDAVVKSLLNHNVKWKLAISSIRTSVQNRTIDVTLSPALVLKNNKAGLLITTLFQKVNLPLWAGTGKLIENGQTPCLQFTIKEGLNVPQTMETILKAWDKASPEHQVQKLLSQSNSEVQLNDDGDEKDFVASFLLDHSYDADGNPTWVTDYYSPVFRLDDSGTMVASNRYVSLVSESRPCTWSEEDLPYLLSQHRHAPARANLDIEHQQALVEAPPAPVLAPPAPLPPVQSAAELEADRRMAIALRDAEIAQARAQEEQDRQMALQLQNAALNPAAPPPAHQPIPPFAHYPAPAHWEAPAARGMDRRRDSDEHDWAALAASYERDR
jgi:hypothetical protein